MEHLIKELNIKTEETIAIGDNVNDIQMIKNAGLGIAMDNSADYIKQYADYITTDNKRRHNKIWRICFVIFWMDNARWAKTKSKRVRTTRQKR